VQGRREGGAVGNAELAINVVQVDLRRPFLIGVVSTIGHFEVSHHLTALGYFSWKAATLKPRHESLHIVTGCRGVAPGQGAEFRIGLGRLVPTSPAIPFRNADPLTHDNKPEDIRDSKPADSRSMVDHIRIHSMRGIAAVVGGCITAVVAIAGSQPVDSFATTRLRGLSCGIPA
jgi:hypothetical protein